LFASLPDDDKNIVWGIWSRKEQLLNESIKSNAGLANAIAEYSRDFLINQGYANEMQRLNGINAEMIEGQPAKYDPSNEEKAIVRSVIRQIWRDWSFEATAERNACYSPILEDITQRYYRRTRSDIKILIPGSGLNRLGFNLSRAGYDVEASEISYIHLLATNFILSRTNNGRGTCEHSGFLGNIATEGAQSIFTICPWTLSFSNNLTTKNQFAGYTVPEFMPASSTYLSSPPILEKNAETLAFKAPRFALNSKNFATDYQDATSAGKYDIVITCFFIDTAPNFLSYVRTVAHVLKPGGTWINIGPLLWNCYENGPGGRREGDIDIDENTRSRQQPHPLSPMQQEPGEQWDRKLEFSHEEIMDILREMRFCVHQDRDVGMAGYCADVEGLLSTEYKLRFWVAVNGSAGDGHRDLQTDESEKDREIERRRIGRKG
jgi:carnosine N-methyltransferase